MILLIVLVVFICAFFLAILGLCLAMVAAELDSESNSPQDE
jgi:hypothetical protein